MKNIIKYIILMAVIVLLSACNFGKELSKDTIFSGDDTETVDTIDPKKVASVVSAGNEMEVHFLDVGQGDSIFIQSPNGKTMLIDAGLKSQGSKVVHYLKSEGVTELDFVVATHPHADHIGGIMEVLNEFEVKEFLDSGKPHTTNMYYEMLETIDKNNIKFTVPKAGDNVKLDEDVDITVLNSGEDSTDENGASIVLKVVYGDVSFLLTGDAEAPVEAEMMNNFNVKSTYLKAGHHGSNTSSSVQFLDAVQPEGTILSYEENNKYGHPNKEVVDRLNDINSKIYSTAISGNIVVTTDGVEHQVSVKSTLDEKSNADKKKVDELSKVQDKKTESTTNEGLVVQQEAPETFKNCTDMRVYYPNGVQEGHPAYASKHDRDKDGWACE